MPASARRRATLVLCEPSGQPYTAIPPSAVCSKANTDLSRDAARQAITLLVRCLGASPRQLRKVRPSALLSCILQYNPNGVLPVSRAAISTVAVIGPVSNASIVNGGPNYAGVPCGGSAVTILQAFQSATPALSVSFASGCSVACSSNAGFPAAVAASAAADLTVVVVGIDQTIEDEGLDRVAISLPGLQVRRVRQRYMQGPIINAVAFAKCRTTLRSQHARLPRGLVLWF